MTTAISYVIAVPSRLRSQNMARLLSLLPRAHICVHESEAEAYRPVVPDDRIVLHRVTGLWRIRKWIIEYFHDRDCVVQIDDDLRRVISLVGRRPRVIVDPGAILQIIENAVDTAADLGIKLFGWSRSPNPQMFHASDPISLNTGIAGAWGLIGGEYVCDSRLCGYGDIDMGFYYLLKHRIVLKDKRFYFDHGASREGIGGMQGIRTGAGQEADLELLRQKWGAYMSIIGKGREIPTSVCRRSSVATK